MSKQQVFRGNFFHAPKYGEIALLAQYLLVVDEAGIITGVLPPTAPNYASVLAAARVAGTLHDFGEQLVLPGFVDLHIHAPQWPQAGVALDAPLNVWLDQCTFPLEAKYRDLAFAQSVYTDLVSHLLALGTTTAVYFATQDLAASLTLAKVAAKAGQRALVGKVAMDNPDQTPENYRDRSSTAAVADTETFILETRQLAQNALQGVYPVVTPRFVPSCSSATLQGLGKLADKYHTYIQSHCSEGEWEHHAVQARFGRRDAEVLASFGLLSPKAIMAHCNFLNESDAALFAKSGTAIAHCPISNAYFANGVLPVQRLKQAGVEIGLGSDISGGFSPSLYDNLKQAVISSRMLTDGVDVTRPVAERGVANSRVSVVQAFYLATRGGGKAVNLPLGQFKVGQICDFQVLDPKQAANRLPGLNLFSRPLDQLAKLLYLATPANIMQVWVQGSRVK